MTNGFPICNGHRLEIFFEKCEIQYDLKKKIKITKRLEASTVYRK